MRPTNQPLDSKPAIDNLDRDRSIGRFAVFRWRLVGLVLCINGCLQTIPAFARQTSNDVRVATIHGLKNLAPEQSLAHRPFHIAGIVVCYDSGWNQLYVYDGETSYFNPNAFKVP